MSLSIISNQAASIAARNLGQANEAATDSAQKLSTGKRINTAADDAAASAIAARLSAEVAGLEQAGVNAGQASSLLQIADGAFQNTEDILTRAKGLAVQAGSDTLSDTERSFLDQEFQALKSEIDRIANDTEFNGINLVNGDLDNMIVSGTTGTTATMAGAAMVASNTTGGASVGTTNAIVNDFMTAGGTLMNVLTSIATTMGGSGTIATMNSLVADGTTGGSAMFTGNFSQTTLFSGGSVTTGYKGAGFDVQFGSGNNISQTISGNKLQESFMSATLGFNVMATGAGAGMLGTNTGQAKVTLTAMAAVETVDGMTQNATFTGQKTVTVMAGGTGTNVVKSQGLVVSGTNAGSVIASLNPDSAVTLSAGPSMNAQSFKGTVTAMFTGAASLGIATTTAAAGGTSTAITGTPSAARQDVLVTGEENMAFTFKVGTGTSAGEDEISVEIGGITTNALGLDGQSIDTKAAADRASEAVSKAIDTLQAKRSDVGAGVNRLDFAEQNVQLSTENQESARSELEDLNVAREITEFSQNQLLVQAGTSTLSQANNLPQNLLQLFQ